MRKKLISTIAIAGIAAMAMAGCSSSDDTTDTSSSSTNTGSSDSGDSAASETLTVGFAQTGSESGWRAANTESMKAAFSEENGFNLVFNAADNDAAAQLAAVRSFINQGVDAIVIAPIVEDGWDDVLGEAKDAGIPVILEDRTVTAADDLWAAWVGDDFETEGETAGKWAADNFGDTATNLVVLEGTTGSAPANDRAAGFDSAIEGTQIKKIDSQTGDFTRDGGKSVMEGYIAKYGIDGIDLVFAQNDDMGLGAIEAIEAAGGKAGTDIQIVTIDATHDGLQALIDGKVNFVVECQPLLGDIAAQLVKDTIAGNPVDKQTYGVDESFTAEQAKAAIDTRAY